MNSLGRLPFEVVNPALAAKHGPPEHQLMLALAMRALDDEERAASIAKAAAERRNLARTPAKWRRIHANVDRAAAAMRHLN